MGAESDAAAPAPAATPHAGVSKKFGLVRPSRPGYRMLPEGARHWAIRSIVLLLGNIIYVGLVTIAQKRLDWMLGYSSVTHMGYISASPTALAFLVRPAPSFRCLLTVFQSPAIWHRRRIAPADGHVGL